ncbi:hypothetical protein SCLCIDRAFT_102105 [Scleroderma citrinum Foug A]|uniref:Ketopantoate reductase C-terminal domain-containing protein n=1 Tax=Scleroderma citrinum Foug A TaxID=1036808 RepID=A0A0C3EC12_9AGAM|nr:hypothetical protein SCLCIDRAFT_102105 [Scleroderma citrinum Foug A]
MRFYVLGLSPLGILIAYHLRAASRPVTLVHKTHRKAWVSHKRSKGVLSVEARGVVQSCGGFQSEVVEKGELSGVGIAFNPSLTRYQARHYVPPTEDIHTRPIDSLIVTTRSTETVVALSNMLPRLNASSTVVLCQDGMGIFEEIMQHVFRNPETRPNFILASNTNQVWFKDHYHVVHTAQGTVDFGIVPDPRRGDFEASLAEESQPSHERQLHLDDIAQPGNPSHDQSRSLRETVAALSSLDALGTKWCPMADLQIAMQKKLVVNAAVNSLTAILGCRNGALFRDRGSKNILRKVCKEASDVFRAQLEHETESYLDSLAPHTDKSQVPLDRMPPELEAESLEAEVIRSSKWQGNVSSTLSDVRHGRRTDIQYFNGYLVVLGKKYGVPTPVNATLCHMVRARSAVPLDQKI